MLNYPLENYTIDLAITESYEAVLRCVRPSNMTPRWGAEGLIAESCKVAHAYDESALQEVLTKGIYVSINHNLGNYGARNSQADKSGIAFKEE